MLRTSIGTVLIATAISLCLATHAEAQLPRQPGGTKARAELFEDPELDRSKNVFVERQESAAIEALRESGHAVEVRCGTKRGWVDRSDLDYQLPSIESCKKGPGSSRGSNRCP